jgi:uncharacterized protein YjbI with pentapeptide repeats
MAEEEKKAWWKQPRWWVIGACVILVLIGTDVVAAFTLPPRLTTHISGASAADQLKAESDLRSAILSLLGALTPLLALIAGAAALLNFQETRRQNLASLEVTQRGQVTDRFSKGIEQLGDAKLDIRMGAIYALEQIARDSEDLHWPVMQILTAYLREHSAQMREQSKEDELHPEELALRKDLEEAAAPPDFDAVADVLRRRHAEWDPIAATGQGEAHRVRREALNFERCNLWKADLRGAQLKGANFRGAWLGRANFRGAQLEGVNFQGAWLERAKFQGSHLEQARFTDAHLQGAKFDGAQLEQAVFQEAQVRGAFFSTLPDGDRFIPTHLKGAFFGSAQLQGALFSRAQLEGTNFEEAELKGTFFAGVDLTLAEGLTQEQLDSAICNATTRPPAGLTIRRAPSKADQVQTGPQ